jgi:hypothetical protein
MVKQMVKQSDCDISCVLYLVHYLHTDKYILGGTYVLLEIYCTSTQPK